MKKMRMLRMLLALLLMFSLSLSVLADDAATIKVESRTETVNVGEEVTLAVSIENNPGFLTSVWKIEYDSSNLVLKSINTAYSAELAGKTVEIPYMNGTYTPNLEANTVGFMNTSLVTDNGTIFTLTFLVKEGVVSGGAAVSVTAKELFATGGKAITAVPVSGGVTIADSTGGTGSTTGGTGSTTGGTGSTTGGTGSTTGGTGSTTGGTGSTTGGTGSTTGGTGSTTGGTGSTTGGTGSTTGGTGSTTGGTGSTTGGTGSTTGGTGSTTGGTGSTTGGTGSTTGGTGSTTGGTGSTTGGTGSTTGGDTSAIKVRDIAVGSENYSVTDRTVTVTSPIACKLGYLEGGKYVAITPTANDDGSYSFEVPAGVEEVLLVVKGDANGDGRITNADITALNAANMKKSSLDAAQEFACDINGDGKITNADVTGLNAANLKKSPISW